MRYVITVLLLVMLAACSDDSDLTGFSNEEAGEERYGLNGTQEEMQAGLNGEPEDPCINLYNALAIECPGVAWRYQAEYLETCYSYLNKEFVDKLKKYFLECIDSYSCEVCLDGGNNEEDEYDEEE